MQRWLQRRVLLFALGACNYVAVARGPVHIPALLPVRSFPIVWIAGGRFAEDEALATALAKHLARDPRLEVRRVDQAELEPARREGRIPPTAIVVLLELGLRNDVQHYWDSVPMQSCGYYGCATSYQTYMATAPAVSGELVMTVYEGPTARVLQRERIMRAVSDYDAADARAELIAQLKADVQRAVDELDRSERVELYRSKIPGVDAAVEQMERGHWKEARARLEQVREHLGGFSKEEQGKFFYDLGMARRFAPGDQGLDAQAYQNALRAFRWAEKLYPRPAHREAIRHLERDHQYHLATLEQREARAHNFQVTETR